ncbi:hypothetical protein EYF80_004689 [Liparis tanakae]|uniref:Uncharacterized protein n=1 Tax=Liparis tanakae TaxID=230148 RepID=A0A4Z2J3W7_9TELE|nr:hypothetical protein EYF80_004689 [Liparis tanakae]
MLKATCYKNKSFGTPVNTAAQNIFRFQPARKRQLGGFWDVRRVRRTKEQLQTFESKVEIVQLDMNSHTLEKGGHPCWLKCGGAREGVTVNVGRGIGGEETAAPQDQQKLPESRSPAAEWSDEATYHAAGYRSFRPKTAPVCEEEVERESCQMGNNKLFERLNALQSLWVFAHFT